MLKLSTRCFGFGRLSGFNLRIAEFAKNLGIKGSLLYFSTIMGLERRQSRNHQKYVDEMLVILPFEKDFYKNIK